MNAVFLLLVVFVSTVFTHAVVPMKDRLLLFSLAFTA